MKAPQLFFLVLVLLSSNASAGFWDNTGPFSILGAEVFDGDWSIADKHGNPVKDIKSSGHIRAWIDIIGFENESIIDEVRYVNGSAKDFAIIKRNAWHTPVERVVSFTSTCSVSDSDNTTTAVQDTIFHWKYKKCTLFGCHWVHVWEYLTVSITVDSPEIFNNSIDDYEITITSYNNSVTPYTLIYIPNRVNIIKHSVHYKNDTSSWYNLTGLVKTNSRGTEHIRFFNESAFIIDENETITRRAEYFVINEAPLNWSLLNIHVYTPYIDESGLFCNVTVYNSEPSDFVAWKPLITLIGILSSFLVGICIVTGRIKL